MVLGPRLGLLVITSKPEQPLLALGYMDLARIVSPINYHHQHHLAASVSGAGRVSCERKKCPDCPSFQIRCAEKFVLNLNQVVELVAALITVIIVEIVEMSRSPSERFLPLLIELFVGQVETLQLVIV